MTQRNASRSKFIFHELDETLAAQLRDATSDCAPKFYSARSTSECLAMAERLHADVVFCGSQPAEYRALLDAVKRRGLRLPVVVVSRLPEVSEWLDALDAGAVDYCAAPFEHQHMQWLIQTALLASQQALA
jgi:DNA-binding NtrC family response regulator